MSKYIKNLENDFNNNVITLSQVTTKRREYNELSDEEKEKLDSTPFVSEDSLPTDIQILKTLKKIEENTVSTKSHLMFYTIVLIVNLLYMVIMFVKFNS